MRQDPDDLVIADHSAQRFATWPNRGAWRARSRLWGGGRQVGSASGVRREADALAEGAPRAAGDGRRRLSAIFLASLESDGSGDGRSIGACEQPSHGDVPLACRLGRVLAERGQVEPVTSAVSSVKQRGSFRPELACRLASRNAPPSECSAVGVLRRRGALRPRCRSRAGMEYLLAAACPGSAKEDLGEAQRCIKKSSAAGRPWGQKDRELPDVEVERGPRSGTRWRTALARARVDPLMR